MTTQTTQDRITELLQIARDVGATLDLDTLLRQIEASALALFSCERVTVFLYDMDTDELYSRFATGEFTIRFPAKKGIAGEALKSGTVINIPDAYADPRFNKAVDKKTGFRTHNLLTVPMTGLEDQPVAVLQLINKKEGVFDEDDMEVANTLALLTGVALQRQFLLEAFAEKQRLERDLVLAQDIQRSLLPTEAPVVEGYDIAGWNMPADLTGGDFYDFIPIPDGRTGLVMADATGHGIGPALIAGECRAILRALVQSDVGLSEVMSRANGILDEDLKPGRFITAFLGLLDPVDHSITYVSGGQAPLLLYRSTTGDRVVLDATSVPLGIISFFDGTPAAPIQLTKGDVFILLTDGFHEWANAEDEDFGVDRIFDVVEKHLADDASSIIQHLYNSVTSFAAGTPQDDDLTAIIVKKQ